MSRKRAGTCASPKSELSKKLRLEGYYPISEVAKRVGLHYSTIYRWVRENIVEHLDFGGAYYVKWTSVVDHLGTVAEILNLSKESPDAGRTKRSNNNQKRDM